MKTIDVAYGGISFSVILPSKINVALCDSGTGKSYFVEVLNKEQITATNYSFPSTQGDIDSIPENGEKTVVIDRADMYELNTHQMENDTNTYLLMGRYLKVCGDVAYLNFEWEGTTIKGGPDI